MRARFTAGEIAAEALRLVDDAGLGALSMRSLAASLGTGPMTLYNYVSDKEGLEELIVAAVVSEVQLPEASSDWEHDAFGIARAIWEAVRAHPAAIPFVLTRRMSSAAGFAAADALIAALDRAGLAEKDLLAAFRAVLGFVVGAAQAELAGPLGGVERTGEAQAAAARIGSLAGADYPHIAALSQVSQRSTAEQDFDRGLRMLLDGIRGRSRS
jgi:AcrR family transcriptional regulator